MRLDSTILFVHCGERKEEMFCEGLHGRLNHLLAGFSSVCVNCATGQLKDLSCPESASRDLEKYLRSFGSSIERYDGDLARPRELEKVHVPLSIFCVNRSSFRTSLFRNLFVHHTDASGLVPAVHSLPVLFDTDYEEQKILVAGDAHLEYALRRAYMVVNSSEREQIDELISALIDELPTEVVQRYCLSCRHLAAKVWTALSFLLHHISFAGMALTLFVLAGAFIARRQEVLLIAADIVGGCAAVLIGIRLSDIPASPAFKKFKYDAVLYLKKSKRHWRSLIFPGVMFFLIGCTCGLHAYHSVLLILSLALGIVEQHYRYAVFQRRLRLTGTDNHAEHMACRILPHVARIAPSRVPPRVSFTSTDDWFSIWDLYAMRVMPSSSRTLFRPKPRVFVSYRWRDEKDQRDADLAANTAEILGGAGITHFLDKRVLKRGLAFRGRVAIEIGEATHFLLLLSKRTVSGKTCGDEARQSLACLPLSMWPSIVLCLLDPEDEIRSESGDPVFAYLLDRADRVTIEELQDESLLRAFLRRTSPESFLCDFGLWMVPSAILRRRA